MDSPLNRQSGEGLSRHLPRRRSHLEVRLAVEESEHKHSGSGSSGDDKQDGTNDIEDQRPKQRNSALRKQVGAVWNIVSSNFAWIPPNNVWSKWKPVIRCALTAWICGVLFIIPTTEAAMGQVCGFPAS